jgi:hypothetical protein
MTCKGVGAGEMKSLIRNLKDKIHRCDVIIMNDNLARGFSSRPLLLLK